MTIPHLAGSYPKGLLLRRWAGTLIDWVVLGSTLVVPDVVLGNDLYRQTAELWLALLLLYFPVSEGLAGRSLGKLITGTKVVTADGKSPGVLKAVVRTLACLVEVNPFLFGGIPAGIAVLSSRHHQRLGDMLAKTYVVRARDLVDQPGENRHLT